MPNGHEYRLLEGVDWASLDGERVELQVSRNYLQLRTKDGQVVTFGKAKRQVPAPKPKPPTKAPHGRLDLTGPDAVFEP